MFIHATKKASSRLIVMLDAFCKQLYWINPTVSKLEHLSLNPCFIKLSRKSDIEHSVLFTQFLLKYLSNASLSKLDSHCSVSWFVLHTFRFEESLGTSPEYFKQVICPTPHLTIKLSATMLLELHEEVEKPIFPKVYTLHEYEG